MDIYVSPPTFSHGPAVSPPLFSFWNRHCAHDNSQVYDNNLHEVILIFSKQGTSFQGSVAIVFNETAHFDFSFLCNTYQLHLETIPANVWDLDQN